MIARGADEVFRFVQAMRSWFLPPSCRFLPTCSEYARHAVTRHGALKGLRLAAGRLLRCHPWHPGGFDAVV